MKIEVKKRGISLIVLVITIIIMIIIAGAIILSLNGSGTIERAHKAKQATNYQTAKEVVLVAKTNWELMNESEKEANGDMFSVYAQGKLVEAGYPENGEGSYEVTEEGELLKYPKIPSGFVASKAIGETKVSEGLVIYEGTTDVTDSNVGAAMESRNQYVWIPVDDISAFVRRDGYLWENLQDYISGLKTTEPFSSGTLSASNDLTGEFSEYAKMYNSVKNNGGFYIARYEAGSSVQRTDSENGTTELIASQKNKYPYNYVAWGPSMTSTSGNILYNGKDQGKGAVELSRCVYPENSNNGVVSTLIYGVQWDAAISFLSDVQNEGQNKPYIVVSINMGWYDNNKSSNSQHKTGIDIGENAANKVKNIYDIGGNILEWSMEAYGGNNTRIYRGGYYFNNINNGPASNRSYSSPNVATEYNGFRIALYLK